MAMLRQLDLQIGFVPAGHCMPPTFGDVRRWCEAALLPETGPAALTVRFVEAAESRTLNHDWRGRDQATNVLAFPDIEPSAAMAPAFADGCGFDRQADPDAEPAVTPAAAGRYLGDIVVCLPVCATQAREQGKSLWAHCAHMVVHGLLHLQGHDHQVAAAAARMEARERAILARFGIADPYGEDRLD